ncbi:hypothetical protein DNU06_14730 [Putridiphycobacter roseus]|uniref:Cytochrome C Planctomycete-type domain-containing protein n=1 Tax=Putridiphycobacter roseus TaxID=2219161 RepID=A0A2W1NAK1_9FLAO|nr:hypothetical protein [Putridiphycobacter roseus]PZE16053.1 hypothetical protein DNU06_14730 [Putridiphycobacter roseus]
MKLIFIGCILFLVIGSCTKNKALELDLLEKYPCIDTISYDKVIKVIMNQSCNTSGCHDNTNAAGYTFTSYELVSSNAVIIDHVMSHNGTVPMPLNQPQLPDSIRAKFKCWMKQGKLNN